MVTIVNKQLWRFNALFLFYLVCVRERFKVAVLALESSFNKSCIVKVCW